MQKSQHGVWAIFLFFLFTAGVLENSWNRSHGSQVLYILIDIAAIGVQGCPPIGTKMMLLLLLQKKPFTFLIFFRKMPTIAAFS